MSDVTHPRQLAVRQLARERCLKRGAAAQAKQAIRLAARLYKAGASVDTAAREAVAQLIGAPIPKVIA